MKKVLYEHNQTAYENACAMLEEKGRAAVIHPTGTGKSFIAFQLCVDHPDKTVCWFSPSEYIFRTQLENWEEACRAAYDEEDRGIENKETCDIDVSTSVEETNNSCFTDGNAEEMSKEAYPKKIDRIHVIDEKASLGNIRFLTYARLILLQPEELADLKPDYIVLDEFHRCGAKMWGQGVQRLLGAYAAVPVLGLSATSIRYLDGQRDMADELFDGNIASEMSLGEAIVRGILNPPKYVLSLYSWQKELERYRERAKRAKNKAVRAEAEKYLEALRRALEKADGLDEIFYKHMAGDVQHEKNGESACQIAHDETQHEQYAKSGQQVKTCGESAQPEENKKSDRQDNVCSESVQVNSDRRCGKYLVFCADYDHMQEMMDKVPEWFHKVDKDPHIYSVYSEDPQSEQSFKEFKADESDHLKLLFCIDMLNEGIHVDDVSGVILLRPTISPIIYKQQIGRALSAGAKKNAVIFDVVMNIENLYSIGTIEEEMQSFVTYYRSHGKGEEIVNEHFRVIDEVQDCMRLFRKLNETLGASWEMMYCAARTYFEEHGDLEAPKRYITEEGYSLGQWLDTQRKVRAGKVSGHLSESQITRLDELHMRWQGKADARWEKYYAAAKAYYEEHGDLLVAGDAEFGGLKLGKWITRLREEKKALETVRMGDGIKKDLKSMDVFAENVGYMEDGRKCAGRTGGTGRLLTEEHIRALDKIGMVWDVPDYRWEQNFSAAQEYYREHGNLDVPYYYIDKDGVKLGAWVCSMRSVRQKRDCKRAELTESQIDRLNGIGMVWEGRWDTAWERSYREACRYREKNGNLNIPTAYVTEDGLRLGRWIRHQRDACRGDISDSRRKKLQQLGI